MTILQSRLRLDRKSCSLLLILAYLFTFSFFCFRRGFTGGPVRNRPSRGGGGGGANANGVRAPKGPKKPKTAAELDQELDAFMGDADVVPSDDAAAPAAGDVDMA